MSVGGVAQAAAESADAWARWAAESCRAAYPILVTSRTGSPPTVPNELKERIVLDFSSSHTHDLAAVLAQHLPNATAVAVYRPAVGAARAEFASVLRLVVVGVNAGAPMGEVLQLADDLIEQGRLWLRHRFEDLVKIAEFDAS